MTDQSAVDRIPLARSVRYAARGLPELPYQYGRGTLVPSEITLTYRVAPDSQLGRVHAYVVGRIHVDGHEIPHHEPYGQHYDEGLDNWPEWLTEEARLHDPAAVAVRVPDNSQTADRDRAALSAKLWAVAEHRIVAEWICCEPLDPTHDLCAKGYAALDGARMLLVDADPEEAWNPSAPLLDAVIAAMPAPADRAAEAPLSPDYQHPECGFNWHGRDGMDIPLRDGQPVCPRCELAKVQKLLDHSLRRREEVGEECKRRGRIKLEQAECIVRLERELDGVRDQLGKELLRADDAEAELGRLAAVSGRTDNETPTAHQPHRGDQFEAWLKAQRDQYDSHHANDHEVYDLLDNLLDTYRLHADTGTPLDEQPAAPAVGGAQPKETDGDRVVAYVLVARTDLHCLRCTTTPTGDIWTPVTAAELEDGGVCASCGVDVLIEQQPKEA